MIEVTKQMKAAFRAALDQRAAELVAENAPLGAHDILDRGLAAVLAAVERDNRVVPRCADADCERHADHGGNHGWFDGREWVSW